MTLVFGFPILFSLIMCLALTARSWTQWSGQSGSTGRLDGTITALAQLIFVSLFLGYFGRLEILYLLLMHAVITGIITIAALHRNKNLLKRASSLRHNLSDTDCFILTDRFDSIQFALNILPFTAGAAAIIFAWPDAPGGTDVWTYHLAFPAEWCHWHDLRACVQPTGDPGPPFYPHHSALIAHFLMSPFRSDIIGRFHQVPFWILGLIALRTAILINRCSRPAATAAVTIIGLMPLVSGWIATAFSDIALAGAIALLYYSVVRLNPHDGSLFQTATFGMTTGLVIGLKGFGAFYALPLVIWGCIRLIRTRRIPLHHYAVWIATVGLIGSFWHMRNWILNGNPLFPYALTLRNHELLPGIISRSHIIRHGFHRFDFMNQFTFSALITTIGIPGMLAVILYGLALIRIIRSRSLHFSHFIPAVMGIQFFFLPYRYHPRFFLPALWLLAPSIGAWIHHQIISPKGIPGEKRQPIPMTRWTSFRFSSLRVMYGIIIATAVLTPRNPRQTVLMIVLTVSLTGLAYWKTLRVNRKAPGRRSMMSLVCAGFLAATAGVPLMVSHYESTKWNAHASELGDIARWMVGVQQRSSSSGFAVAFTGFNTPYPLNGPRLLNTVRYLSRDGDPGRSWAGDRPFAPLVVTEDPAAWSRLVSEENIRLIVIGTLPGQPIPVEYFWVRSLPAFTLVYLAGNYQCWAHRDIAETLL